MRTGPRRLGAAALALTVALLLAGCDAVSDLTGGGVAGDPTSIVLASADKTTEAGSSRFSLTATVTGTGANQEISGEGVMDHAGQRGNMTLNLPGVGPTTTIIDGTVIYQQVPAAQAAQVGGTWMRIDATQFTGDQGGLGGNSDPSAAVDWLRGASGVTEVGQEDVRGDTTTRYEVTLDLQAAAQASGDPATQAALESLAATTTQADVWIDGEGRMRRMSYGLDMNSAGQAVNSSTTVELWDFGVPVEVTPPPDNEIVDLNEVLGNLGDSITEGLDGAVPEGADPATAQELDELQQQLEDQTAELQQQLEDAGVNGG